MASLPAITADVAAAATESACALPQNERPQEPGEPVELCGTNTLQGDTSGRGLVKLTTGAVLDLSEIVIEGAGTFVGFALAQDPPSPDGIAFFHGWTPDQDETPQCRLAFKLGACGAAIELPPGRYRVYLLAPDGPVTVRVPLAGLEGETSVPTPTATGFDARHIDEHVPDATGTAYAAGNMGPMSASGTTLITLYGGPVVEAPIIFALEYGYCLYSDPVEDESTAFLPGCPDLPPHAVSAMGTTFGSGVGGPTFEIHAVDVNAGVWGHGFWYVSTYPMPETETIGVWVPFD